MSNSEEMPFFKRADFISGDRGKLLTDKGSGGGVAATESSPDMTAVLSLASDAKVAGESIFFSFLPSFACKKLFRSALCQEYIKGCLQQPTVQGNLSIDFAEDLEGMIIQQSACRETGRCTTFVLPSA